MPFYRTGHGHPHHEDGLGRTTRVPALGQVRSLVYPQGFKTGMDGGLRVVPGGHLYRQARLEPASGDAAPANWTQDDEVFQKEWLDGKTHPLTEVPLRIVELELPPGSIVSCLSHCPHAVSPKDEGLETRLCTLFCYGVCDAILKDLARSEFWTSCVSVRKVFVLLLVHARG